MQKKIWVVLALLLVVPGLVVTVSCQKKAVMVSKEAPPQPEKEVVEEKEEAVVVAVPVEDKDMVMQENIYFEFDKSALTMAAQENLMRKAEWLQANPTAAITIEGHCDERGTNEYNLALGERRAESAKRFLMDLGIDGTRMTTISYGEERPVCFEKNEECWAKNRRDAFIVND
jgi:peptidoglycan-associated lipoprotein